MFNDDVSDDDIELVRRYQAEADGKHICEECGTAVDKLTPCEDFFITKNVCKECLS